MRALSAPNRMLSSSRRPSSIASIASITSDFPAPVSPVMTLRPGARLIFSSSIIPNDFITSSASNYRSWKRADIFLTQKGVASKILGCHWTPVGYSPTGYSRYEFDSGRRLRLQIYHCDTEVASPPRFRHRLSGHRPYPSVWPTR